MKTLCTAERKKATSYYVDLCTIENGMLLIKNRVRFQLKMNFSKTLHPVAIFLCVSVSVYEFLFLCVFCGKQKVLVDNVDLKAFEPVEKLPNIKLKAGGTSLSNVLNK